MKLAAVMVSMMMLALCQTSSAVIAAPAQSQLEGALEEAVKDQISFIKENPKKISVRADPAKCLNDLTLLRSEPYLSCAQFVSSFRFNPQNANSTGVEEFCHKNCSQVMINSIQAVVTDCGLPSYELRIEDEVWLNSTCATNANGVFCGGVYSYFNASSVEACVSNYNGEGPCPTECKTAEDFVRTKMGCCYGNFADYFKAKHTPPPPGSIPENFWKSCGEDAPKACPLPTIR